MTTKSGLVIWEGNFEDGLPIGKWKYPRGQDTKARTLAFCQGGMAPHEIFARAIMNGSTSPSYVLVRVTDGKSGKERAVCTGANLFLGAIHREFGLDYSTNGQREALAIAFSEADRRFTFSNRSALENIEPRYSVELLEKVRKELEPISEQELDRELGQSLEPVSALHRIYMDRPGGLEWGMYRDAVAHVLLERGVPVALADVWGGLVPANEVER